MDATVAPIDMVDAPVDMVDAPLLRVSTGLVGFWTFDETTGTRYVADTSGTSPAVPLEVIRGGTISEPTFSGGTLTADPPARIISAIGTRLAGDCRTAGAVTLEVWLQSNRPMQGSTTEPVFVAGLAGSVALRDIALMQAGDRWVGQIRTGTSDGKPNLLSATAASTTAMTHVVLVADATQRRMYVNSGVEAMSAPGTLSSWDPNYAFALVDEVQHTRQWTGSIALVALYNRTLNAQEVSQNFSAGPNAAR